MICNGYFLPVTSLSIEQNLTKLSVIVTGKPKISISHRQVLPDIDLWQTRFRKDWHNFLSLASRSLS